MAGYSLDIDIEGDGEERGELGRPLIQDPVVFDAEERTYASPMPRAVQASQERDEEDVWAELG